MCLVDRSLNNLECSFTVSRMVAFSLSGIGELGSSQIHRAFNQHSWVYYGEYIFNFSILGFGIVVENCRPGFIYWCHDWEFQKFEVELCKILSISCFPTAWLWTRPAHVLVSLILYTVYTLAENVPFFKNTKISRQGDLGHRVFMHNFMSLLFSWT